MVSCCILHCKSTSANGSSLKCFPKNENLKDLWIKSINRPDWTPKLTSCICQMHFSTDMWEIADNKKKLKVDAVPTIFPSPPERKRIAGKSCVRLDRIRNNKKRCIDLSPYIADKCLFPEKAASSTKGDSTGSGFEVENWNDMDDNLMKIVSDEALITKNPISSAKTNLTGPGFEVKNQNEMDDNSINMVSEEALIAKNPTRSAKEHYTESGSEVESQVQIEHENNENAGSTLLEEKNIILKNYNKIDVEKFIDKQEERIKKLKKRLHEVIKEKRKMAREKHSIYKTILLTIFTEDQISYLIKKQNATGNIKPKKWSKTTIKKALRLRFACGNTGYEELLRQGFPLPSRRTLNRNIEHIKFQPGISDEMFEYLKYKVANFDNDCDRECSIALDEVSILGGKIFDPQTKQYIGGITLPPDNEGTVKHGLVYILTGIHARWKQVIGYEFTGGGYDGALLKPKILQIISKAEEMGLRVNSVTCDMGPCNVAFWNSFGVTAGRNVGIKNSIPHPHPHGDCNRRLYFFADVPHVLKSTVQSIINNKKIYIPVDIQQQYSLPTNIVNADHLVQLIESQEDLVFTLTPNLRKSDILLPNSKCFQKMKVKRATKILSSDVSAALYFLSEENSQPEFETTAWFVGHIARWFRLMTSRNLQSAISKFDIAKYHETISFLNEMINLFTNMKVGDKGYFKPIQKGFMMSTTSAIQLSDYLLEKKSFKFVLTSRFTQDVVENLFSVIRSKHVTPNVLQFKYDLRLISIAQYTKQIKSSNYDYDDSYFLNDFLKERNDSKEELGKESRKPLQTITSSTTNCQPAVNNVNLQPDFSLSSDDSLNDIEKNSLYSVAGYLINSIQKTAKHCNSCIASVGSRNSSDCNNSKYATFTALKEFKENSLFFVNEKTFDLILQLEQKFRYWDPIVSTMENVNLFDFYSCHFASVQSDHILPCHNLKEKILRRFILFRLRINNRSKNTEKLNEKAYDSKSMAMHLTFR